MSSPLRRLTAEGRRSLLVALRARRIAPPFSELSLRSILGSEMAAELAGELSRLSALGLTTSLLEEMLMVLDDTRATPTASLVWTGPEDVSAGTRDTGVVVRNLFERATSRLLIAGFAVHQGASVFQVLAERMDRDESLDVEMYLNVERPCSDTSASDEVLRRYAERFRNEEWSGQRRPRVFYDPRALELGEKGKKRAVLHAKCVVVDGRHVLVSSANFTAAAQERNIEVGVLLDDGMFAASLVDQFAWLVRTGHLKRLPGL